jgi:hypothetical protein
MPNLFPDIYPTIWEPEFDRPSREIDEARDGYAQINSYDPVDMLYAHGEWQTLTRAKRDQLKAHRDANVDRSFNLFDFWFSTVSALFVATADGTATVYTLPAKAVAGMVARHNGSVAGTQPSLSVGTGADGQDQLVYTSGSKPGAGVVVTFDAADARLYYEVLYRSARFPMRHRGADIFTVILDFIKKVAA